MSSNNPYEPPQSDASPPAKGKIADEFYTKPGVWRAGNLLVMHLWATLPHRCVVTNQPAERECAQIRLESDLFSSMPGWMGTPGRIALLISPFLLCSSPCAGVVLILWRMSQSTETSLIDIPLSSRAKRLQRRKLWAGWLVVAIGLGLAYALWQFPISPLWGLFVGGAVVMLGAGIIRNAIQVLQIKKLTGTHVWLAGADPDYLAALREVPQVGR